MLDVRAFARGPAVATNVFERLVFRARFGAEITAVMDDEDSYRWRSAAKPALVLMRYGQEGSGAPFNVQDRWVDSTLRLWLYPLPPPEPGTLAIISPNLGPGPAGCPLDGRAIVAASVQAQPYRR